MKSYKYVKIKLFIKEMEELLLLSIIQNMRICISSVNI